MKKEMLTIAVLSLVWTFLISESLAENPCTDYTNMNMDNGLRSSDFDSSNVDLPICDANIPQNTWYRFDDDSGTRLIETPVPPWHCGTQAPIWMNGTHPTTDEQTTATVCAVFSDSNNCEWNATIIIQMCNVTGYSFFVYKLAVPPGCPLAYCVDASSRKECVPPLIWIDDEFRCGENVTRTTRAPTPTTTPAFTTTTPPPDADGWGPWGPWSVCSKPCNYGMQSRGRTCMKLPCLGDSISYQICNTYNCQELPEEKNKGIVLDVQASPLMDTMLKVVQNEQTINDILRSNINGICLQNASLCCGQIVESVSNTNVFVTSSDIYSAQSFPRTNSDGSGSVYCKTIAVVNEDTDNAVCRSSSVAISKRQADTTLNYIPLDVMKIAAKNSEEEIFQKTGLNVKDIIDPSDIKDDDDEDSPSPSTDTVVIIIVTVVVVVVVVVVAAVILIVVCCYFKKKSKGDPPPEYQPASGPPPLYEAKPSPGSQDNSVHPCGNQFVAIYEPIDGLNGRPTIYPPLTMSRKA